MRLIPTRRTVALVGAALSVAAVPAIASTSASAADSDLTTYKKTLTLQCDVTASYMGSGVTFDDEKVLADVSFSLPKLKPGTLVGPTKVNVALQLSEALRDASTGLLGAVAAEGRSTYVTLGVKDTSGSKRTYRITDLAAARTDIPQTANTPWIINASGTAPQIFVANQPSLSIIAPEHLDIDATLFTSDGTTSPVVLSCDNETDRTVADIKIGELPTVTAKVEPGVVKAGATDTTVLVKTTSPIRATGYVFLKTESGKIVGNAQLNKTGNVRIKLDPYYKTGRRTLTVDYQGDAENVQRQITTKFSVVQ